MQKIKSSHIIYLFIVLFPFTNFILPFFIYGDEMNIRIYLMVLITQILTWDILLKIMIQVMFLTMKEFI